MKKTLLAIALACTAAQVFAIADSAQFRFKKGINFSGLEDGTYSSYDSTRKYLGQDSTYTTLTSKGFDHVRLAVDFRRYYNESSQTLKSTISNVDMVVDKCEANGLYVFLDFHGWANINTTNGTDKAKFLKIWELVADHYKDRSDYVIFELLNEPHTTEGGNLDAAYLNALQAEVLPIIRQTNPNRLVLLAAAEWNGPWKLSDLTIPSNPGPIGVVCHTYAPMAFTHQGATWGGYSTDHVSFTSTDKTSATGTGDLDNAFRWIDDFQEKTGIPVVMNEFGVNKQNSKATDDETLDWTRYVARNCESNGIAWTWWEYNRGMGAYYNNSWRAPVMNGLFPAEPTGNSYASSFNAADYAKKITISFPGYAGGSALANFPVLVKLSTAISGFSYSDFARANGDDLRFTDSSGNLIPHEVDTWNPNGVSTVWVKVPSLTAATTIKAYYGCSLPVEVDSSKVWSNGYVGVWHLGEGGLPLRESSKTSTDFTKQNGSGIKYAQDGAIGGSVDFGASGNSRMITAHDCDALDGFANCTVEAWTYQTNHATAAILSKRYSSSKNLSYFLYDNGSKTQFNLAASDSTTDNSAQIEPTLNQWVHQAYTFAAGTVKGYKDGDKVGSDKTLSFTEIANSDGYLHLGNFNRNGAWNADTRNFPGKIDEVRISNVARSADWLQATYDTVKKAGFASYAFGDAEPESEADPVWSDFSKFMTVFFRGVQNGVTLTNFPVLVKLSTDIDGFSYADFKKPNGGDLRFSDSAGNFLPHEIDTWNSNGVSMVWVKVPVLSHSAKITAHYGATNPGRAPVAKDVWDDDYVGVWHLGESALPLKESSETSSDFATAHGTTIGYAAPGIVGGAVDFPTNGTYNSLVAADHDALDGFSKFTVEAWTFQNEHKANAGVLAKRGGYTNEVAYYLYDPGSTMAFCVPTNKTATTDWTYHQVQTLGEWNHLAYTVDMTKANANVHGIKNGVSSTWYKSKDFYGTMANCASDLCLGNMYANNKDYSFNGQIDEVRISKAVRSDAWLKATYDTIATSLALYRVGETDLPSDTAVSNLLLKAATDKGNPIDYVENEDITFNFTLSGVDMLPQEVQVKQPIYVIWTRTADDGVTVKGTNTISLTQGFSVTTSLAVPGIVKMTGDLVGRDYKKFSYIDPKDGKTTKYISFGGGAGVATEKMQLSTVEPADFDRFWAEAKEKLATVPFNDQSVELVDVTPSGISNSYTIYAAKIPCFGPRPVTGWLTIPRNARPGTLPIQATFEGYGCISAKPKPPTYGAGQVVRLAINAHGYDLVEQDDQYYKDFNDYINKTNRTFNGTTYGYALAPQDYDNPTNTYFYYMAMRVMRAYDYLKSRPEWDGTNVWASGGSQGGLQTMWAGGLVGGVTKIEPSITWGCDIGCPFNGNGNPYPSRTWGIPCVPGAFYFDSALHAKRVPRTCVANITRLGMGDYTCPPRGVLLSYYNMKCPVSAQLVQGSDHGYVPPEPNQKFVISKAAEAEPPAAFAIDVPGYDYTNRVVTVTNLAAGASVTLAVASMDNAGVVRYVAMANADGVATFDVVTEAGKGYAYRVLQDGTELASGEFVAGGWQDGGSWFSASAESGSSVVANGARDATPAIRADAYVIDGVAEFGLSQAAAASAEGGLARVEFNAVCDGLFAADELSGKEGAFGGIAAAESSGVAAWYAFDGAVWRELSGAAPAEGVPFVVRVEADFAADPALLRYSVSADGGATFVALADKATGSPYVQCAATKISTVLFDGAGQVAFLSGSLMGADVAEADGVGYASLADALAAGGEVRLLTNVTWPTNAPVGTIPAPTGGYDVRGVTFQDGKVVVSSGYSKVSGEGRVNIDFAALQGLGISTANKAPAEIAAALQAKGANGLEKWESYVLGLDPADATAKPKATIALDGGKVELSLVGVNVTAASGATVTYKVRKAAELADVRTAQPLPGDHAVGEKTSLTKDASDAKMFYQLDVDVKGY